jgi:hypothetical protein
MPIGTNFDDNRSHLTPSPAPQVLAAGHARRFRVPRYFITWSGHVQAGVQSWPSCNCGEFPAVDHDRSRT